MSSSIDETGRLDRSWSLLVPDMRFVGGCRDNSERAVYYPTGVGGRQVREIGSVMGCVRSGETRVSRRDLRRGWQERGNVLVRVTVEVLGNLRRYLSGSAGSVCLELPTGSTVRDALCAAGVPADALWNASIGGRLVYASTTLGENDCVLVFAPIGGGDGRRQREGTIG